MATRLIEIIDDLSNNKGIRCVVLTGSGSKSFSSGADISEFRLISQDPAYLKEYAELWSSLATVISVFPHPLIAMISGNCIGGGLLIALLTDIRIAAQSAQFGIPAARLGISTPYEFVEGLLGVAGLATTLEILLEGRIFDAYEAKQKGLVSYLVEDSKLFDKSYQVAKRIASNSPLALRSNKKITRLLSNNSVITEADRIGTLKSFLSEDFKIGYTAFEENKKPNFVGR